ncbi:MAG: hypothetical protein BEN19_02535 [Epulopiscium sp. Nuni2H_MBin003]|nr:MAG: hypothetical protein BEN19_02535 [Epulopiscium sp. Nuni2H_MBin003]
MKTKYQINIFFALVLFVNLASNLVHPITPAFFKQLELNDYMFGIAFATMSFSVFFFSPFWGKMATLISENNVIFICCIGYALGQLFFMSATTEVQIILARLWSGSFSSGILTTTLTYIAYISTVENKALNLTIFATVSTLGVTLGYFVGGILGDISLQTSFIAQICMLLLSSIVFKVLLVKRSSLQPKDNILKDANPFSSFLNIKPYLSKILTLLLVISFVASFATTAFDQTLNYYLIDELKFSTSYNGYVKAGVGIVSLLANVLICFRIIRNNKILQGLAIVFLICSFTLLLIIFIDTLSIFLAMAFIYFGCNSIYLPLIQNCCASYGDENSSAIILAFYNAVKAFGMIMGALVAGFMYEISSKLPFILASISFFICFIGQYIYAKKHRQN